MATIRCRDTFHKGSSRSLDQGHGIIREKTTYNGRHLTGRSRQAVVRRKQGRGSVRPSWDEKKEKGTCDAVGGAN